MWLASWNSAIRLIILLMFGVAANTATAQTVISGKVFDENGEPVESAIVRLLNGQKMVGYAMSKADGAYSVKTKSAAEKLTLSVERLSYAKYAETIVNKTSTVDVVLTAKANELREVTVKAPMVYVRGDTLTFRLDAFKGKGDISLKDAMKKIPGIQIDDSGAISYQGKQIKNFYIEGLDLLDGKYNLATDNIPADYVQAVQVLNNHKDSKIDKDRFSDDVAINIKLEPWARFKPMGTYEAAAGWGDDTLYRLGGSGMMFNKSFQAILTAKISNVDEFADNMVRVHAYRFSEGRVNLLESALGRLSGSKPPMPSKRYRTPDDKLVSLNMLNKLKGDAQLRTQASYAYSKGTYGYSMIERYYDGDNQVVIDQSQLSEAREHKPEFTMEYRINSEKIDLTERLEAKAAFFDASLPTWRLNDLISQDEALKTFDLRNVFSARWVRGLWHWSAHSNISYQGGPEGHIDIRRSDAYGQSIVQSARTSRFYAKHGVTLSYHRLASYLIMPVDVTVSSERIKTNLSHDIAGDAYNRVRGMDIKVEASPQYSYNHPRQVINFMVSANIKAQLYNFHNDGTVAAEQRAAKLTINPSLHATWNVNAKSSFMINGSYNHGIGDILDMLTAPMASSYIGLKARSGIIAENKVLAGSLAYKFQMPVEMLFFNASVNHSRTELNLLSAQSVDNDVIGNYTVNSPAHGESTGAMASLTKRVQAIKTKFSLSGSYNFGRQETFQNEEVIPYKNRGFSVSPSVNTTPFEFVELGYTVSLSKTFTRFA
ncbi:MAG: carboxypeptidase-like regulatory domain-containing protein, partial [Muribaculaceae bacterium]|nr:carboxypeptidase-like regulatory domain-containing protein [Muribaculaceae bacterium]